jgi:hypothetical protein
MRTTIPLAAFATILACTHLTDSAHARDRVFVASYGNDANPCTFGSPCKTFQAAVGAVAAAGEVTAIDSAGFGPINITKSVTITSPDGVEAGIVPNPGSPGIFINTTGDVFLRGLTIEGGNSGNNGLTVSQAGTLSIVHCVMRHFTNDGIFLQPTSGSMQIVIQDSIFSNNGHDGIDIVPTGSGAVTGTIDRVTTAGNSFNGIVVSGVNATQLVAITNSVSTGNGFDGILVFGSGSAFVIVTVRDTAANSNGNAGFHASSPAAAIALSHSVAVNNNVGVSVDTSAEVDTTSDNFLAAGNLGGTVNPGTLTPTGYQ